MSKKEQWTFLQKLAQLLESSISLGDAVQIAGKNIKNKGLQKIVEATRRDVAEGKSLSESFSTSGDWNQSTLALIYVGEVSGTLFSNLRRASENMKSGAERKAKMIAALFYPAIISLLAISIIVFLLTFVYPKITPLFIGMKTELPLSTRIIMFGSTFLGKYFIWILLTQIVFGFAIYYLTIEFIQFRLKLERFILKLPVIGKIVLLDKLSEAAFIIGSLCQGGMNITDAIRVAERSESYITIQNSLKHVYNDITAGMSLSESVSSKNMYPSEWNDLITIGEKTGELPSAFINISKMHRQDIDETMDLINKLIEPVMMIFVGGVVGFIALSIITPMYSLTQNVHGV